MNFQKTKLLSILFHTDTTGTMSTRISNGDFEFESLAPREAPYRTRQELQLTLALELNVRPSKRSICMTCPVEIVFLKYKISLLRLDCFCRFFKMEKLLPVPAKSFLPRFSPSKDTVDRYMHSEIETQEFSARCPNIRSIN